MSQRCGGCLDSLADISQMIYLSKGLCCGEKGVSVVIIAAFWLGSYKYACVLLPDTCFKKI